MKFSDIRLGRKNRGTGCVYAHIVNGEIVYIGYGSGIDRAFNAARQNRSEEWIRNIHAKPIDVLLIAIDDDKNFLRSLEPKLIFLLNPKYNIMYKNLRTKQTNKKFLFNGIYFDWRMVEKFELLYEKELKMRIYLDRGAAFEVTYNPKAFYTGKNDITLTNGEISW